MKLQSKYSEVALNLLVAVAITLVVNFSYLLLLLVDLRSESQQQPAPSQGLANVRIAEGRLEINPDGHGYLITESNDSIYVHMQRIMRLGLSDGNMLVVETGPPRNDQARPIMRKILMCNGEEFDYGTQFNRPSKALDLSFQLLYYLGMSFILLSIITARHGKFSQWRFLGRIAWCLAVVVALYFIAPVTERHSGRVICNFAAGRMLDYMLMLKCSFAAVVSILYGWIYLLISQRQAVVVENEQLKNENLTTRYNMLVGQINPHFFFNSLNSLAMLVREKHNDKALTYIDQLSYTFRYIIQNGQSTLLSLEEELKFADAYSYLFRIRYADKLFFDIDVDERYRHWMLPALSLQPLIDNAVKHNTITRSKPFRITIRTEDEWLVISNPKVPKIEPEPSTGIGLENLRNRWHLITGRDVEIIDTDAEFIVRLPLRKPTVL